MDYYIGIDGGGTKCRLLATTENGEEIARVYGGSTNISAIGREGVRQSINEVCADFTLKTGKDISECKGLCIGSASVDSAEFKHQMEEIISEIGFTCPVLVVNDGMIALAAATKGSPGVVLISGTGCIAFGVNKNGIAKRCGGWGHVVDDLGSGYWIGRKAVLFALEAFDGRGKETALTANLMNQLGIDDVTKLMDFVYAEETKKSDIAHLTRTVYNTAKAGDALARELLEHAGRLLSEIVFPVLLHAEGDGVPLDVVHVSGSVISKIHFVQDAFMNEMRKHHQEIELCVIDGMAEEGAIFLARAHAMGEMPLILA